MRVEEVSDEVAERIEREQAQAGPDKPAAAAETEKDAAGTATPPQPAAATTTATVIGPEPPLDPAAAMFPGLAAGRVAAAAAGGKKQTVDEVVADLKKTPFFMTELEENDDTEALKALAYEGSPLENAGGFKERGNESFKARRWADAKEFYTKGIQLLAAEELKRREGRDALLAPEPVEGGAEGENHPPEEAARRQRALLEPLYVNRAACHLELRNHRSCWLDAAAALRLNPANLKAYYRSARALLAVGRLDEARDACDRGLAADPDNAALRGVAADLEKREAQTAAKRAADEARRAKEALRERLLAAALAARSIRTRATAQPPQMEDAALQLVPDPEDPASTLSFPAVLLYPVHLQSDFVKAFHETESAADHLDYILPPPWDSAGEYSGPAAVDCYMETVAGGLIKVGKKVPLLKVLSGGKVEVVDGVVRLFVVPRAKAEAWVAEFKVKKAAERGS